MWSLYEAFDSSFNPVHEHSRWKREVLALTTVLSSNPCDYFGNDKRVLPPSHLSTDHCIHTHASPWEEWEWVRNTHGAGKDQTEKSLCSNAKALNNGWARMSTLLTSPGAILIKLSVDFTLKVCVGRKAWFCVHTNVFRFIKPWVCRNLFKNPSINPS